MHDDDENETEVTEEDAVFQSVTPQKNNIWIVITAFLELFQNIFECLGLFFEALKTGSLQRFLWERNKQEFFEEASLSIEAITDAPAE